LRAQAVAAGVAAAAVGEAIEEGFEEAQKIAQTAADNLAKAIEGAAGDFSKSISIFAEEPEKLEAVDLDDALSNIEKQISRIERFRDALDELSAAGLENVVADLAAQGPAAVLDAEALASDIGTAFDLEEALSRGNETALETAVLAITGQKSQYVDDMRDLGSFLAANIEDGFAGLDLSSYVLDAIKRARSVANVPGNQNTSPGLGGGGVLEGTSRTSSSLFQPQTSGRIVPSGVSSGGGSFSFAPTINNPSTQDLDRSLDTQRNLLLASVGRMVEAM
jgi:hypothetical protein